MIISKQIATEIAKKLTQKKYDALEKIKKEISEKAYEIAKADVKKDIFEMYEKNKSFFKTSSAISFIGTGLNYESVTLPTPIPSTGGWNVRKQLNDKQASVFVSLFSKRDSLKKELRELFLEIENALLSLKSYLKITAQFPEAAKYLPIKENKELMINISAIVKKL